MKKLFALFLALILTFSLCACSAGSGSSGGNSDRDDDKAEDKETSEKDDNDEDEAAENGSHCYTMEDGDVSIIVEFEAEDGIVTELTTTITQDISGLSEGEAEDLAEDLEVGYSELRAGEYDIDVTGDEIHVVLSFDDVTDRDQIEDLIDLMVIKEEDAEEAVYVEDFLVALGAQGFDVPDEYIENDETEDPYENREAHIYVKEIGDDSQEIEFISEENVVIHVLLTSFIDITDMDDDEIDECLADYEDRYDSLDLNTDEVYIYADEEYVVVRIELDDLSKEDQMEDLAKLDVVDEGTDTLYLDALIGDLQYMGFEKYTPNI